MLLIVGTKTADGPDIFLCQRGEKQLHLGNTVGYAILSKDIAVNNPRPGGFGDITDARRQNSISVVDLAIFGQKADKALREMSV